MDGTKARTGSSESHSTEFREVVLPSPAMSTLTKVTDKGGNSFNTHIVDGQYYSPFPVHGDNYGAHLNSIKGLKLRDDDVIIMGYAKSGMHWMWEVTRMLVDKPQEIESQFFEKNSTDTLDAQPSPRILTTHYRFRYLPKELVQKKTKIIYLLRNPKDVAVSMYHHTTGLTGDRWGYETDWTSFFKSFIEGPVRDGLWFDYVLDWEKAFADHPQLPVCTIVYEDMKEDPLANTKRLAEFLGIDASSEFCGKVVDACSLSKLRHAEQLKKGSALREIWKSESKGFYRKGEVGDWKNWFTVAQSEQFDAVYQEKMRNSKLNFRFE